MIVSPKNTLAHVYGHQLFKAVPNLSDMTIGQVMPLLASQNDKHDLCPDTSALTFYATNHAIGALRAKHSLDQPLPEQVGYIRSNMLPILGTICTRAFVYLLVIATREARHEGGGDWQSHWMQTENYAATKGKTPAGCKPLVRYPENMTDSCSVGDVLERMEYFKPYRLGDVVEVLMTVFKHGDFSSGYGGEAWWDVTQCLQRFVNGEYTTEQMLDTVWTLAHNGGPIFNKGMYFKMYDGHRLYSVLDVQSQGMIPAALRHEGFMKQFGGGSYSDPSPWLGKLKKLLDVMSQYEGFTPDATVDWHAVTAASLKSISYGHWATGPKGEAFKKKPVPEKKLVHVAPSLSITTVKKKRMMVA